jgi:hypothetical protein
MPMKKRTIKNKWIDPDDAPRAAQGGQAPVVKGPVALPVFFSPPETPGNNLPGADEVIELNYVGYEASGIGRKEFKIKHLL